MAQFQQIIHFILYIIVSALIVAACGGSGGGFDGSSSNKWIWVSGSNTINEKGNYGTLGVAAPTNTPGARYEAMSWTDTSGNLWLFGGRYLKEPIMGGMGGMGGGFDGGYFADLWKFDGTQWTWVSGSDAEDQAGNYGALGIAAPTNEPGGREGAVSWVDASGNLWLFGGNRVDTNGVGGLINDLWRFDGSQWTWVSGSNIGEVAGNYGSMGVAAPTNIPGSRTGAVSWTDPSSNLWLFGGNGYDSTGSVSYLNDLWKFDGSHWTWVSGSNIRGQVGNYGSLGVAADTNVPGARGSAVSWTDARGNLWLFGGYGVVANGVDDVLNDLWKFDGTQWTWVSGSNTGGQAGNYGTLGVASPTNVPGARHGAVSWTDTSGNLWLFGGGGVDANGRGDYLNDLWMFDGTQWTWVLGSDTGGQAGNYGTLREAAPANVPGGRLGAVSWVDTTGSFWLFGGSNYSYGFVFSNDMWRYQP